ncbi:MAG TPA: bifunctional metallophosphatase/5'-nucleotidase [Ignavibacteria bacterium]|nr:bifunctional metallophosphatase/5'-nucleotidase [Ignavibacteria bacterium]
MLNILKVVLTAILVSYSGLSQTTEVVFIQMNDVYEIAPLEGGKYGGLARVKTVIDNIKQTNPHTFVILSGDFISPSALGTSAYEDKRINGRQMVDVLNAIGLDFVTFGNHEFDYKYEVLQDRLNESKFTWISSNTFQNNNGDITPFKLNGSAVPEYKIIKTPGYLKGLPIRLGVIGICIDANKQSYVSYNDYYSSAKKTYEAIKDSIDYLIGITHLNIDDDKKLAAELPELKLIMGGHEHVNMLHKVGETIITKADANAITVYVHRIIFDEQNKLLEIKNELVSIDEKIPEEPEVKQLVDEWVTRAFKGFYDKGFDPLKLVFDLKKDTLDGKDETTRYTQCALGYLIGNAMFDAAKGVDLAFFNSGAIRLDDKLTGEITQYDIIRVLPFGGKILQVELKGSLLKQIIETGFSQPGSGGYLQYYGLEQTAEGYKVKNALIDDNKTYTAAVADYLLSGMEHNFGYLTKDNPGIVKVTEPNPNDKNDLCNDVRFAVINFLEKWYKPTKK